MPQPENWSDTSGASEGKLQTARSTDKKIYTATKKFGREVSLRVKQATISVGMRTKPIPHDPADRYPQPTLFVISPTAIPRRPSSTAHDRQQRTPPAKRVQQTNRRDAGVERITVTVEEAAAMLGISRTSGYEHVRTGQLPAIRIGRRLLVPIRAINNLLDTASRAAAVPRPTADNS